MHIPDGYLSPETCVALYGVAAPFWYKASQRIKRAMSTRMAPLISIFAAFSFAIQMINIPVPGGTTAHAVGGTLMAIVLGPWPAVIGISVALTIQALFFGDGGITTLGANAFNLAVALPLIGYGVYRLLCYGGAVSSRRRVIAAAIGSYVGINVAGLLVGVELGIQPILWSVGGKALYSPYDIYTTVPALVLAHATIAGLAEALLTGLALGYLLRTYPHLVLGEGHDEAGSGGKRGVARGLIVGLAALVLVSPLGLLASGSAFGEWGANEMEGLVGYVPSGFTAINNVWQAVPLPGYQLPGLGGGTGFLDLAATYILSGAVGIGLIFVSVIALRMILVRR